MNYWLAPTPENAPEAYLAEGHERSEHLVKLVRRYAKPTADILEIGCNAGRNLSHLHRAGFMHLSGIEINEQAVVLLRTHLPDIASKIMIGSVEDTIPAISDDAFDLVFTMAVLEHLPPESAWVFAEIARIGRTVVTIEDEGSTTPRHFPRNYGDVFGSLGMTEVEQLHGLPELAPSFVGRVFR